MDKSLIENYKKSLQETFEDPTSVSSEKLRFLVEETMRLFSEIREKFESKDPAERENALYLSMEMKSALESQMDQISKLTGIDPSQFAAFNEKALNLSREDADLVAEIQQKLRSIRPEEEHKKKHSKANIIGV